MMMYKNLFAVVVLSVVSSSACAMDKRDFSLPGELPWKSMFTQQDQREFDEREQKKKAWIKSVLDGKVSWNERFEVWDETFVDSLTLATMTRDLELVTAVLACKEGKAFVRCTGGRAPLHMSFAFGGLKVTKLLLSEPTLDVNQCTGFGPAILDSALDMQNSVRRQLLGDARLTLINGSVGTGEGVAISKLVNAIADYTCNWARVKKLLVALVSRRDFPSSITESCFSAVQKCVGTEKNYLGEAFSDVLPTYESLLQAKEEFLACKRAKLKKRKTKIQILLDAHQSSQLVDEVISTVFDIMRSGKSATSPLLEQVPFKQYFALLRDLSAYGLQEND
jgi:hypothetical protein